MSPPSPHGVPPAHLEPEHMRQTVVSLLAARSLDDRRPIIAAHPELLTDEADHFIEWFTAQQKISELRRMLEDCRALLRRCRDVGIDRAFAERSRDSAVERTMETGVDIPAEFRGEVSRALSAQRHFAGTGDPASLERAAALWQGVSRHPRFAATSSEFQSKVLGSLGANLLERYQVHGRQSDIETGISALRAAIDSSAAGRSGGPRFFSNMGLRLADRYRQLGRLTTLEAAIAAFEAAVDDSPSGSAERPGYLSNLGSILSDRYHRTGQLADLDASIGRHQEALNAVAEDSPSRAVFLTNLGSGFLDRYAQTGRPADVTAAVAVFQTAVDTTPADSAGRAAVLTRLGAGLFSRYQLASDPADLDAAITVLRAAVDATSSNPRDLPLALMYLAGGLAAQHVRTGQLADLEASIAALQRAVDSTPAKSPERPTYLTNLGTVRLDGYRRTGQLADLDAAIAAFQAAVDHTPGEAPNRWLRYTNLGSALADRFRLTRQVADLDASITAFHAASTAVPADSRKRPLVLTNLGAGLLERFGTTGRMDDLTQAIQHQVTALETAADSPDRPLIASNLGAALARSYQQTQRLATLDASITALREAVNDVSPESPHQPRYLANLAGGFKTRYARNGQLSDLKDGVAAYERACQCALHLAPEVALTTARAWGDWATHRRSWEEAGRAYSMGLRAIDQLYETQLLPGAKETWLQGAQGIGARAAYSLARSGDSAAAAVALERSRARLMAEAISRDRADLATLRELNPDAYTAYEQAARQLRQLEVSERGARIAQPEASALTPQLQQQAHHARTALHAAIANIRRLPGYEAFLTAPTLATVAAAVAGSCPVAYLVTTSAGSLVLLAHRQAEPATADATSLDVEAIEVANLTSSELSDLLARYDGETLIGGYLPGQLGQSVMLDAALAEALPRLGTTLVEPLAARLRALQTTGVILIPSGLLSLLPIHAAQFVARGEQISLADEFDVSYAPSARVLTAAQRALADRGGGPATLTGVGNPLPTAKPLAFAHAELEEVAAFFGDSARPLYEETATKRDLLAALPGATYVHLACHGIFDANEVLNSHVQLASHETLTLREFLDEGLMRDARLVVLSACQTAVAEFRKLPDESIGVAAGILQAGAAGVVATLWSVNDLSTALLMTRFYELHLRGDPRLGDGPLPPARALRRAQQWLRSVTAGQLFDHFERTRGSHAGQGQPAESRRVMAIEGAVRFALEEPDIRPFAAPYHWAPFVLMGA